MFSFRIFQDLAEIFIRLSNEDPHNGMVILFEFLFEISGLDGVPVTEIYKTRRVPLEELFKEAETKVTKHVKVS